MLRRTKDLTFDPADISPELARHQADMVTRCPYLGPSITRGLTTWQAYSADPGDQADLLALLVDNAEALRVDRRTAGPLVCRNLAIAGPADVAGAKKLLDWPAWLARNLYAPVQLMIGRFWIGVELNDSRGQAMTPPPVSFFTMRHAIPHRDGLFLQAKLPEIMAILAEGPGDDGRDVFAGLLGRTVTDPVAVYNDLAAVFPNPNAGA